VANLPSFAISFATAPAALANCPPLPRVTYTRCAVDRRDQIVTPQGGTATRSETESFLDNELREGVFRTFGFLKPKRLFSRIKLVMKNDLAPRRGYCWDHASSPKVLQEETALAEAIRT
jgi:hypothetical protein